MSCKNCNGNCGSCSGCANALELTEGELEILHALGQFAFLPIARRADDMVPVYLEAERHSTEQYSLILQVLEQKGLISLDYDQPLPHANLAAYAAYPVKGSMALTARGQTVVELLDIAGIS